METLIVHYDRFEKKILQNVERNGIKHRPKTNTGLWLGILVGLSAAVTILKEENSYSEICLFVGTTGFSLVLCSFCLYARLSMQRVAAKDFHVIYFLPAIVTSILYLFAANRGLLTSVTWGLTVGSLGTWGVLQLMSAFPYCFTMGEATAIMHSFILFSMSAVTNLPLRYHLPPIHDNDISTALLQIALVVYWAVCVVLSIFIITYQISSKSRATSSTRKIFHILAMFVYIPGMICDISMLYLASGVIFALLMGIELIRLLKVPPLGKVLQDGFVVFADEKDFMLSLTPLYLMSGLSFPLWMPTSNLTFLALMSGVLTVGVGDTAASFVGGKWGSHKWVDTDKTIEGTVACVFSQVCVILALTCCGFIDGYWLLLRSVLAAVAISLIEARTNQVDNLALPLLMYVCLMM
ncbi:PREDICTED: dolichol kinase isoform X3 [Dinoponera quadriceps]|uniref:dolichol kinase n=1 Tax=Dinoponera quadriceps TaxID=609295 RepID=A0A6P3XF62_DINQU|nr:PREDICTED: dolichol kinase isoform X3 [Dinoponera quadriceps]